MAFKTNEKFSAGAVNPPLPAVEPKHLQIKSAQTLYDTEVPGDILNYPALTPMAFDNANNCWRPWQYGMNQMDQLDFQDATGGTWKYSADGGATKTAAIQWNATLAQVQAAFDAKFGAGNTYLHGNTALGPDGDRKLTIVWTGANRATPVNSALDDSVIVGVINSDLVLNAATVNANDTGTIRGFAAEPFSTTGLGGIFKLVPVIMAGAIDRNSVVLPSGGLQADLDDALRVCRKFGFTIHNLSNVR